MRWLHLTDIHVGRPDQAQSNALNGMVEAIRIAADGTPFDALLLTGDLAYSGRADEYALLDDLVIKPLQQDSLFEKAALLMVPGNHDIDCDAALPCPWAELDRHRQTKWFANDSDGQRVRAPKMAGHSAYSNYLAQARLLGVNPLERCSSANEITTSNYSYTFISVNTASFSYIGKSDKDLAPAPVGAITAELQASPRDSLKIVLGHHPISWFLHATQQPFRSALLEYRAIYVHGHLHQVQATHMPDGIESIGFGAVYAASQESPANPYYENSFAICELADQLHVAVHTWDAVNGRWCINNRLPPDFQKKSPVLAGGYCFRLAQSDRKKTLVAKTSTETTPRRPDQVVAMDIPTASMWWQILALLGETDPSSSTPSPARETPGEVEFRVEDQSGARLIRCISGHGRILSVRELEAENTRLDTADHDAVAIFCLGEVDEKSRELAAKLKRKKRFVVLGNENIATALNARLSGPLSKHLDALAGSDSRVQYVLLDDGLGLLVQEPVRLEWFYVVLPDGTTAVESHKAVQRIRETNTSRLAKSKYRGPGTPSIAVPPPSSPIAAFERAQYLAACQALFNEVKYAPLAALGMKFPKAALREIYVPAQAEVESDGTESEQLRQALDDFVDSLDLDEAARAHMRAQLSEQYLKGRREDGSARAFYQQHRNVLVLGDPGSGKTCFVKHEILSYCEPPDDSSSWYRLHVPIFVPLFEAAALLNTATPLLNVCAIVCARQGLGITREVLDTLVSDGRAAFFFDGLDEIPSVQTRADVLRAISELLDAAIPYGNRLVVTSRPAALEALEVPSALLQLHLKSLTKREIETLARNILAFQLTEKGEKAGIRTDPSTEDSVVIQRLLADCDSKPGIGRIARNPLLLSLLVVIYATSGAPSAKKHRVYAAAVQTLVSVRNRVAGQQVLSESDLRLRLGALALAIKERRISELPGRDEVAAFVAALLVDGQPSGREDNAEADMFLRKVAEGTGLLTFHQTQDGSKGGAHVTFMHHSFLEYYAAVALVARDGMETLSKRAELRRWREIVSLAAGIVGDRADVAPLIDRLLVAPNSAEQIVQAHLLFAFDCALECDVAPDRAQRALMDAVAVCMRKGPARVDSTFRADLAERVARLWEATGSPHVTAGLVSGLQSTETLIAAAYVDLCGRMAIHFELSSDVIQCVVALASSKDAETRIALFGAVGRAPQLRVSEMLEALKRGFSGRFSVKYAAVRTVEDHPSLGPKVTTELREALDDVQLPIATTAARALLNGSAEVASGDPQQRALIAKALLRWSHVAEPRSAATVTIKAHRADIDRMLSSPVEEERILAIRLLPWLERQEQYVHDRLFEAIGAARSSVETSAALSSLRLSAGALALITPKEVDQLIDTLKSPTSTRDVRLGAFRSLSALDTNEKRVGTLIDACSRADPTEFSDYLTALVASGPNDGRIREYLSDALRERLIRASRGEFGSPTKQAELKRLMRLVGEIGMDLPQSLSNSLVELADNYKANQDLRAQAVRTFARAAKSGPQTLAQVLAWLEGRQRPIEVNVRSAVVDMLRKARQRVDAIREIYPTLGTLESALISEWNRIGPQGSRYIDDYGLRGLRAALHEVRDMQVAFQEFSDSSTPSTSEPQRE